MTEADLAAQLNVSKTPVREAFIKLRQIGLLEPDGRRAWRVIQLSRPTIDDACEVREALEVSAARAAAERATLDAARRDHRTPPSARSRRRARATTARSAHGTIASIARSPTPARTPACKGLIDDTLLLIATLRLRDLPASSGVDRVRAGARRDRRGDRRAAGTDEAGEAMRAHVQQVKEYTFGDVV